MRGIVRFSVLATKNHLLVGRSFTWRRICLHLVSVIIPGLLLMDGELVVGWETGTLRTWEQPLTID